MFVAIIRESGYEEALMGLSLSFYDHNIPLTDWEESKSIFNGYFLLSCEEEENVFWTTEKFERAKRRAKALTFKGGGHNKFLESICVWLYVQAPRSFWSEFDTYRIGMTKNSSSTMHTLDKRFIDENDFEEGITSKAIDAFNEALVEYKNPSSEWFRDITRLKNNLPEGWLQERQICTNYMTLQNILYQREGHRLKYWSTFEKALRDQLRYPELVFPAEM